MLSLFHVSRAFCKIATRIENYCTLMVVFSSPFSLCRNVLHKGECLAQYEDISRKREQTKKTALEKFDNYSREMTPFLSNFNEEES